MNVFVCPSDPNPVTPFSALDLQVPKFSYINNYAAIPAHDFFPVSMSVFGTPASLIVLTDRRNTLPVVGGSDLVLGQWKGLGGFYVTSSTKKASKGGSQPCSSDVLGVNYRYLTMADMTIPAPSGTDKPEALRAAFTRHQEGANYTFADGHAKWLRFPQTLDPNNYLWGERFYPPNAPATTADGSAWSTSCN